MKLAHLSDPHLVDLRGVPLRNLVTGKCLTGYVNLLLRRRHTHLDIIAKSLAQDIAARQVDHVVVTGDLTNLALDPEIDKAVAWLHDDLGMTPDRVTVVPGNHDHYTTDRMASGAFEQSLAPFMRSDDAPLGARPTFPMLRLRGPLAIIGLDTAVPRPPFVAAGKVGAVQLQALRTLLADDRLRDRTPVVLLHHPPVWLRSWLREMQDGLRDAPALQAALPHHSGMFLHGHAHETRWHQTRAGSAPWFIGAAPSASNASRKRLRTAGYNTYEFDDHGCLIRVASTTLNRSGATTVRVLYESSPRPRQGERPRIRAAKRGQIASR